MEKGDVEGVESSQEESSVEDLPPPPSVSKNGTVEGIQEHHSITVTGTWKYWTKSGDYREPDVEVPARLFLVQLLSGGGSHKAYGYTDWDGDFSISGVDPSGGIKSRLWCYVNHAPYSYEIRVVSSGDSLTGITTDVWHLGYTNTFNFPDGGQEHSIGTWTGDGAFWIKDDLDRASFYPSTQPGPATARWMEDSTHGNHYHPAGQIHLIGIAERAPDVVIHEAGHNVMYNLYEDYYPVGTSDNHSFESVETAPIAWKEGWASFLTLAVNGNGIHTYTNGRSTNLETPT